MPWGIMPDVAVKHKVTVLKELPKQPPSMTEKQWQLIQKMCAWEPAQRLDMTAVVEAQDDFRKQRSSRNGIWKRWRLKVKLLHSHEKRR